MGSLQNIHVATYKAVGHRESSGRHANSDRADVDIFWLAVALGNGRVVDTSRRGNVQARA